MVASFCSYVLLMVLTAQSTPDLPANLAGVIKDSTITPVVPPQVILPEKAAKANVTGTVWLRVKVGEAGRVENAEAVWCDKPDYGFEKQAIAQTKKSGLFTPRWLGPDPVEYTGYYPFSFAIEDTLYTHGLKGTWAGSLTIKNVATIRGYSWDGPALAPDKMPAPVYPAKAVTALQEGQVVFRLLINKRGAVAHQEVYSVSDEGFGFEDAAAKALRKAQFPVRKWKGRAEEYPAYTTVSFVLTDDILRSAKLPLPDDKINVDHPPSPSVPVRIASAEDLFARNISGAVSLQVLVIADGRPVTVQTKAGSGSSLLDSLATDAARHAQFLPATTNGTPIACWANITVTYDATVDRKEREAALDPTGKRGKKWTEVPIPDVLPRFDFFSKTIYPAAALDSGIEGAVKIAALISETGKLLESHVAQSGGFDILDSAALASAASHMFIPAQTGGKPAKGWLSWSVDFTPDSKTVTIPGRVAKPKIKYPRVLKIQDAVYPSSAQMKGVEGTVWLKLYVDSTGAVTDAQIAESSGHPELDKAALDAAPHHRFYPATQDGKPVGFWLRYRVDFSLTTTE